MKALGFVTKFTYWSVNFLLVSIGYNYAFGANNFNISIFSVPVLVLTVVSVFLDNALPNKLRILQMGLTAGVVISQGVGDRSLGMTVLIVTLSLVCLLKLYAIYLGLVSLKERFFPAQVASGSQVAANFYNSGAWRKLRYPVLVANERKYGRLTCELCKSTDGPFDVDHIKPRSKYPHLALDINNLQCLCADCNRSKGADYEIDHRSQPA